MDHASEARHRAAFEILEVANDSLRHLLDGDHGQRKVVKGLFELLAREQLRWRDAVEELWQVLAGGLDNLLLLRQAHLSVRGAARDIHAVACE